MREVHVGSDFSGLDTAVWALRYLGIPFTHRFACDSDSASQKVLAHLSPKKIFTDIRSRSLAEAETVDLYTFGPPCQSYSKSGKRARDHCELGQLALYSVAYVVRHKPKMLIMEQVPDITDSEDFMQLILAELQGAGYTLHMQCLRSCDYGLPQSRVRLYLVGILNPQSEFVFPEPIPMPTLSSFIEPLSGEAFELLPGLGPRGGTTRLANVTAQLEACVESGLNPFSSPVVIASGASKSRCNKMVGMIMTITKTEAARGGYWCTTKGGFLDLDEMARLQGFWTGFLPWTELHLSEAQFGGLIGNAMSLNILMHLLPPLLLSSGYITQSEFQALKVKAAVYHPKNHFR